MEEALHINNNHEDMNEDDGNTSCKQTLETESDIPIQ